MEENFYVNYHASICIGGNIYLDPLNIKDELHNAAAVFITHGHWDHYSAADIRKVANSDTVIIAPKDVAEQLVKDGFTNKIIAVEQSGEYRVTEQIKAATFPAYNIEKSYHTKDKCWVGYVIETGGVVYAICGDTDFTAELKQIKCDVLFVPIGGTYTMTAGEAADCANTIKPKIAVPIHYLGVVGDKKDEQTFIAGLNKDISYKIFFK
jgi:L-ascorbate metabolism protein UlaG (beta-lactamase superfamily)